MVSLQQGLKDFVANRVKVPDDDRKASVAVVQEWVEDQLIVQMREVDPLFEQLYQTIYYAGSSYEGLKVGEADEFDLNLVLKLPFRPGDFQIQHNGVPPGFVVYKLTKSLKALLKDPEAANRDVLDEIFEEGMDNPLAYLSRKNLIAWFQSVVDRAMNECEDSFPGNVYRSFSGPAATLKLRPSSDDSPDLDVDLVPVITLDSYPASAKLRCRSRKCHHNPKPFKRKPKRFHSKGNVDQPENQSHNITQPTTNVPKPTVKRKQKLKPFNPSENNPAGNPLVSFVKQPHERKMPINIPIPQNSNGSTPKRKQFHPRENAQLDVNSDNGVQLAFKTSKPKPKQNPKPNPSSTRESNLSKDPVGSVVQPTSKPKPKRNPKPSSTTESNRSKDPVGSVVQPTSKPEPKPSSRTESNRSKDPVGSVVQPTSKPETCFLVPKQAPDYLTNGQPCEDHAWKFFRVSMPNVEREILKDRGCVKMLIKIFKAIRDEEQWSFLPSYYIKTVFMWRIRENPACDWSEGQLSELFKMMMTEFIDVLRNHRLPHIFFPEFNLLANVPETSLTTAQKRLEVISRATANDTLAPWLASYFEAEE